MAPRVIDSHQHFWGDIALPWMSGPYAVIAGPHGPETLRPALRQAGVDATVVVQVQASLDETREFLAIAEATDFVAGVVGWVPLDAPDVADIIAELRAGPNGRWLVGVRHLVHDEADPDWLGRPEVRRGLAAVADAGLVYDLLARPPHLPACIAVARDFPDMRLVLDHIGKPPIASGAREPWASLVTELASHTQVRCKLSGMVTEADLTAWRPDDLRPYIEHVLEVFGPERCMFGSDWPVCRAAADYGAVKAALETVLDGIGVSGADRAAIMGETAERTYELAAVSGSRSTSSSPR